MVTGQDLINLGFAPGKWFKDAIQYANQHNLAGDSLNTYIQSVQPKQLVPFENAVNFFQNIRADSEEEKANLESVKNSMYSIMKTPTVVCGAIMPDACPTMPGEIPVGGVVVTKDALHPSMHSSDVCCSVMMTNLGMVHPKTALDVAHATTHFGGGGRDEFSELPPDLEARLKENSFLKTERSLFFAKNHLATQGDGNHFLFVGISKNTGQTMMVTHHGSRGLGAYLFTQGMKTAEKFRAEISPKTPMKNAWIPYSSDEGKAYWSALQLTREWTKLNHATIHNAVASSLHIEPLNRIWNEHNFVFKEGDLFYHAKGATPLDNQFVPDSQDGLRLIPLNMSQPVLIVYGSRSTTNLGFAPHGAGRNRSRRQHKQILASETIESVFRQETKGLDIRFFSKNVDISELPSAYKDADSIKEQMNEFGLGHIQDEILPYGCIMAGDWQLNVTRCKKNRH